MDIKKYMIFDLVTLTIIGLVAVFLKYYAETNHAVLMMLDFTMIVVFLATIRWSYIGSFILIPMSIFMAILYGGESSSFAIYIGGSITYLLINLWFVKFTSEEIVKDNMFFGLFIFSGFTLMFLGRSVVALLFGYSFLGSMGTYYFIDSMSILMCILVMLLMKRKRDLYLDFYKLLKEQEK